MPRLERAGRDSFTIRITMPPGLNGRRKQKRLTTKGTKREALAAVERFKAGLVRGDNIDPGRVTVSAMLDRWLQDKAGEIESSTLERYQSQIESDIRPALGHLRLTQLTPQVVNEAIHCWKSRKRRDRKSGLLGKRTIRHTYDTLRAALNHAVRMQMLARNPCDFLKPVPKGDRKVEGLGPADVPTLTEGLYGTIVYCIALIAIFCGLRRGEILGLDWSHIDLETGVLSVSQALEERKDKSLHIKGLKTRFSRRNVVLPPFVLAEVRRHRAEIEDHFGPAYIPEAVFPNWETGRRWSPDAVSSRFYYLVRARKLPRVSLHGLRHTYSNIMKAVGVQLIVTSRALGHADVSITGNVYTDVTSPDLFDAASRLQDRFGPSRPLPDSAIPARKMLRA